jgi:hypothetical protein
MKATQDDLDFLDAPFVEAQASALEQRPAHPQTTLLIRQENRVSLWGWFWDALVLLVRPSVADAGLAKKTVPR